MARNKIVNAPSKFDLSVAFFDRPIPVKIGSRRSVMFVIEGPNSLHSEKPINVVVNSISWEDGSGESWCFEGYCTTNVGQPVTWDAKVKGWFRTLDRKGWIDIDAPAQSNASRTAGQVDPGFRKLVDELAQRR